jgi:transcriptional regulator with XRE-family HTH domain
MNDQDFRCPECHKGTVRPRRILGRKATVFPGVQVQLPEAIELPTCDVCGDYSVPESMERVVKDATDAALLTWQAEHAERMVALLCDRHRLTRRRIAAALDITPAYLSNVTSGAKPASAMLLRLLRAFVTSPAQLIHALEGQPIEEFESARARQAFGEWAPVDLPAPANRVIAGRRATPAHAFAAPGHGAQQIFLDPLPEPSPNDDQGYDVEAPVLVRAPSKESVAA